jgi:nicotinamidase-related amidase
VKADDSSRSTRALLLLDLQETICREDGEIGRMGMAAQVKQRRVLENAAWALAVARRAGFLVAFARLAFDDAYSTLTSGAPRLQALKQAGIGRASSPGAAICSEIAPLSGEIVASKTGIDPLIGTPIMGAILGRGITEVALGGVATNHVVESCARHAADAGLHVVVLADLCAAQTEELHRHSIESNLPFYATVTDSRTYLGNCDAGAPT